MLPAIGIPTTAGTGSEAQSFALISDADNHRKMACGDHQARFRSVILDPGLLASVPTTVAAASGLDAVSHAVESFVTTRRNPVSNMLARKAWSLLESHIEESLRAEATIEQQSKDVAAFLMWAAEPKLMARKQAGFVGVVFLTVLSVLLYLTNKRLWAPVKARAKE